MTKEKKDRWRAAFAAGIGLVQATHIKLVAHGFESPEGWGGIRDSVINLIARVEHAALEEEPE